MPGDAPCPTAAGKSFIVGGIMIASIMIIDSTKFTGELLKKALEQANYNVVPAPGEQQAKAILARKNMDLTAVNLICRNYSGLTIFNKLGRVNGRIPMMTYLLNDMVLSNLSWVLPAVTAAMVDMKEGRRKKRHLYSQDGLGFSGKMAYLLAANIRNG